MLRTALRTTTRWSPLLNPEPGYSIVVGVPWKLWDLVQIPLVSLERSDRSNCREVILAVDATSPVLHDRFGDSAVERVRNRFSDLNIRVLFYSPYQQRLCRVIAWNWVDCWLTWVEGLANAQTRYVLLHDFDAVVVDEHFIERHYAAAVEAKATFAGIWSDDRIDFDESPFLLTAELMVDAQLLRNRYQPVDLFNRVRRYRGYRIECDILRDVQMREPRTSRYFSPLPEDQIVHPHQVISEWCKLQQGPQPYQPDGYTSLLFVPYFQHVAGDSGALAALVETLEHGDSLVKLDGRSLQLDRLDGNGAQWIEKQMRRLIAYFNASNDPLADRFCVALRNLASSKQLSGTAA